MERVWEVRRGKGRVEDNESEYIFSKISHMSLFGFRLCLCIFVGVWVCGCVCPGGCEGGREGGVEVRDVMVMEVR